MTHDSDAKQFTEGLVRIANKYGYRMKQFISSTHRVLVNDAEETLEIELVEG
jgi:thymidine phosphorylase